MIFINKPDVEVVNLVLTIIWKSRIVFWFLSQIAFVYVFGVFIFHYLKKFDILLRVPPALLSRTPWRRDLFSWNCLNRTFISSPSARAGGRAGALPKRMKLRALLTGPSTTRWGSCCSSSKGGSSSPSSISSSPRSLSPEEASGGKAPSLRFPNLRKFLLTRLVYLCNAGFKEIDHKLEFVGRVWVLDVVRLKWAAAIKIVVMLNFFCQKQASELRRTSPSPLTKKSLT